MYQRVFIVISWTLLCVSLNFVARYAALHCEAGFRSPSPHFQMSSQASKRQKTSKVSFKPQKTQVKPGKLAIKPSTAVAGPSKPSARSPPPSASASVRLKAPVTITSNGVTGKGREGEPFRFKVIAGSYEKILYGLQVDVPASSPPSSQLSTSSSSSGVRNEIKMKPIFIFPAHISCVKAVAASPLGGKWLATGGTDETIKVWDLKRRKELGGLSQHQGWFLRPASHFMIAIYRAVTDTSYVYRFYYVSVLPYPIAPSQRLRGWNNMSLSYSGLGALDDITRTQRTGE